MPGGYHRAGSVEWRVLVREEFPVGRKAVANSEGTKTMKKLIFPVLLTAAALTPATAIAEDTPITVEISYDKALLASDEGAKFVLTSMRKQAKDACSARSPVTGQNYTDYGCVTDIMSAASVKILEKQEQDGLKTAPVFARQAVTLVADAGQR